LAISGFAQEEDARLEDYFRQYLEQYFQQEPMAATQLGDHRFDRQLDDLSKSALKERLEFARRTLKNLPKRIDYKKLTRNGQIDFEIFQHDLERGIWSAENLHPFESNPRIYNEYISGSVYLLLAQSSLPKETNISNAIARMGQIPKVVEAARENLKNPPRVVLETAIRQNQGSIDFYQHDLFELAGETSQSAELKAAAAKVVPTLKSYQDYLEKELLPNAHGEWRIGKRKFYKKLKMVLDAGVDADEVLADAEAEFSEVRMEMYVIARQLWSEYYPKEAVPPDDEAGRRELIKKVIDAVDLEHGKPEELLDFARQSVARIKKFISDSDFLRLPEPDRCQVIEMPKFERGNSLAYLNPAPPLDPKSPSFYAISPPLPDWDPKRVESLLREYNKYMIQILTIHEGYPGHYVQLEYANRTKSLIRRVLGSGVFAEGWAVYTERTMLDQGYGNGNLKLRLMQLKFYLRAVGNAILDHKMHCSNMSDEEAMDLLVNQEFQSQEEASQKVIRSKQSSVQLSTYFVGRMAFYRLRQQVQRRLGEDFDLGRFHEAVLDHGSIPVKYLPELVNARLEKPR
jgi:uncharacterized protein (DUF885 family)